MTLSASYKFHPSSYTATASGVPTSSNILPRLGYAQYTYPQMAYTSLASPAYNPVANYYPAANYQAYLPSGSAATSYYPATHAALSQGYLQSAASYPQPIRVASAAVPKFYYAAAGTPEPAIASHIYGIQQPHYGK